MKKPKPERADEAPKAVRCAIYTRKSTDEGLKQEFNSLDAQREAAEAFIKSQAAEGWVALPERYDDGGFSGGNMERPAVQRLLADVDAGKVDCIVVYKVDRLSRSLLNFARMMELLDHRQCSFVSVTQQFNTTHSMGRLTLNILLSFAQFEREIISERTRDKMSAARRKGKWVGGPPILGYDLDIKGGRLLLNEREAEVVKGIFGIYLEKKGLIETMREINVRGWERKRWLTRDNRMCGGGAWDKGNLYSLLRNMAYIGKVNYKGEIYPAEHPAIVDAATWSEVQAILRHNGQKGAPRRPSEEALLRDLLCCANCRTAMLHTYTSKQQQRRRYRYYLCMRAHKQGSDVCPNRSVSAPELEKFIIDRIREIGRDPEILRETLEQAELQQKVRLAEAEAHAKDTAAEVRRLQTEVKNAFNNPGLLADLADRLGRAEQKLASETALAEQTRNEKLDKADLAAGLGMFDPLWDAMSAAEKHRVLSLMLERVSYNGKEGTVAITFRPNGVKTLAAQSSTRTES